MTSLIEVPPGLAGVAVTTTTVGDVRGDEGYYHYRDRSAVDLARTEHFETVAALVLAADGTTIGGDRALPASFGPPQPGWDLRTGLSWLGTCLGLRPVIDIDRPQRRLDAEALISAFPTLVATLHTGRLVTPRVDLGHVANYLWMLTGSEPPPAIERALEQYLILTIDHGFNNSTFTARVIASTGADFGACVVGGLSALTGPRHGGAPGRVLDMLDAVERDGDPDRWLKAEIAAGRRLMGFGHAVYRSPDPRSVLLAEVAAQIAPARYETAEAVEIAALKLLAGRRLVTNVELYAAVVLEACGIPQSLYTATFAVSRLVGWCAHVLEQATESKIIRPAAHYVGPLPSR